jgi:hypothetical protein
MGLVVAQKQMPPDDLVAQRSHFDVAVLGGWRTKNRRVKTEPCATKQKPFSVAPLCLSALLWQRF